MPDLHHTTRFPSAMFIVVLCLVTQSSKFGEAVSMSGNFIAEHLNSPDQLQSRGGNSLSATLSSHNYWSWLSHSKLQLCVFLSRGNDFTSDQLTTSVLNKLSQQMELSEIQLRGYMHPSQKRLLWMPFS